MIDGLPSTYVYIMGQCELHKLIIFYIISNARGPNHIQLDQSQALDTLLERMFNFVTCLVCILVSILTPTIQTKQHILNLSMTD